MKLFKGLIPKGKNARYTGIGGAVFFLVLAAFIGPRLIKQKEQNQAANLPIVAPGSAVSTQTGLFTSLPAVEQTLSTLRPANVYRARRYAGRRSRAMLGVSPFRQKILM